MYSDKDSNEIRMRAALDLLRHKLLKELAEESKYPSIKADEINEVFVVAGMPVVVPGEVNAKEVEIIKTEKEDKNE